MDVQVNRGTTNRSTGQESRRSMVAGSPPSERPAAVPSVAIARRVLAIRGQQVMLDGDLAELYGVETKRLIEQVKRNIERFPDDFMFQLSVEEIADLRSQFATPKGRGGRRTRP